MGLVEPMVSARGRARQTFGEDVRVVIRKEGAVKKARDALSKIADRSIVASSGFNMVNTPEYLFLELMKLYKKTGHPRDIFLIMDSAPSVPHRALDKLAEEMYATKDAGLIRGISTPYFGFMPTFQKLVAENMLEAYSWPMGAAASFFREVAAGRPGVITKIGLDTYIDPKEGGGRLNQLAEERNTCRVRRISVDGGDYLLYEAPKPDFALVRATSADGMGNLTMERELFRGTILSIVQAAKAHPNPGTVIAQVEKVQKGRVSYPRMVEVPGPLVDYVVVSPPEFHWQSGSKRYDRHLEVGSRSSREAAKKMLGAKMEPGERIVAGRVLLELVRVLREKRAPIVVNLGIGVPALVSRLASEERLARYITTALESGQWGGVALSGIDFGIAIDPFAVSVMPDMFYNFEGGVIDAAALGFLQVGASGDVNPSMIPGKMYGPGGFPVIAGGSPRLYFAGMFTAGHSEIDVRDGKLTIVKEGKIPKFVDKPLKSFFSGNQALKFGKEVLYMTERAVFRLTAGGLELLEVAPGIDVERDVVAKMRFRPKVSMSVKIMDRRLFAGGPLGLAREFKRGDGVAT